MGIFDLTDFGYANSDLSALRAVFDLLQVILLLSQNNNNDDDIVAAEYRKYTNTSE